MKLGRSALARHLGVSRQTVYQYEKEGKIPPAKDGGWDPEVVAKSLADKLGTKRGGLPRKGQRSVVPACSKSGGETRADYERAVWKERAEKLRLENLKAAGVVVDAVAVESETERRFRAEAEAFLNWPTSVSAEMAAELGIPESLMSTILNRRVREFMRDRSLTVVLPPEEPK